jgi:hypothetical protein
MCVGQRGWGFGRGRFDVTYLLRLHVFGCGGRGRLSLDRKGVREGDSSTSPLGERPCTLLWEEELWWEGGAIALRHSCGRACMCACPVTFLPLSPVQWRST